MTSTQDDPEIWREVPGWPMYQVSTHGRLRSFHLGKLTVLKGGRDRDGYRRAVLVNGDTRKSIKLHHMVLWAFHGPCPEGLVGRHADGNIANNRPDNLSWATQRENIHDKIRHGTMPRGERHARSKLTSEQVLSIRANPGKIADIASAFGIAPCSVSAIRTRRVWAWL